jgi:predicted PhzF superfamily epimerase YddE/YHI9
MELTLYQVDAFADRHFEGNPAAVIPLETWLPDDVMQSIAEENNLSETAFFAPKYGIDEDSVTGSAHTQLTPYWSGRLGKTRLTAKQISRRGGELICELHGDRVLISGKAVKYLEGKIELNI